MPLLHKKPFVPQGIPDELGDDDTVFFCKLTKEMFTDYDEFCERIILCNSLVWSCSLTGRSNLTFQEAASSEEKTKRLLKKFPPQLRVPVLYLASLCERKSLLELTEDVFCYVKDRFFIGETVQINLSNNREANCKILAVCPPTPEELESSPKTDIDKDGERTYWPPGHLYKYEIEIEENNQRETVTGDLIFRRKTLYSKDKNRLYIKQFVHLVDSYWKLKSSVSEKYGISDVKFSDIFCGEPPILSPKSTKKSKGAGRQQTLNKYFKPSPDKKYSMSPKKNGTSVKKGDGSKLNSLKQKRKRRTKSEMKEANSLLEAKQRAKAEMRERKQKLAQLMKERNMKKEDLECEDLRELPTPIPVDCRIPHEYFGEAVMVMEFLHTFRKLIPVKDFFPNGVNLELIERALVESEIAGPYSDLIQLFLVTIFDLLEQESDEIKETDVKITQNLILDRGVSNTQEIIKHATSAFGWVRQHHGAIPLNQLTLDTSTLTEVLRLHMLTSGYKPNDKAQKWRYQNRGGYCNYDDPAIQLKISQPHIIQNLSQYSVCQLSIADKVTILNCLINQIITYTSLRDSIDENADKVKQCRAELRAMNVAEQKKKRELKELKKKQKENGEVAAEAPEKVAVNGADEEVSRALRGKPIPPEVRTKEEVLEEMYKAIAAAQMSPLGLDRAYRRFWVFSSLPGLFVEQFETEAGPCLPKGTPTLNGADLNDTHLESVRTLFEGGANKENLSGMVSYHSTYHPSPSKKLLAENNGADAPLSSSRMVGGKGSKLTCWGDMEECPVHSQSVPKTRWSFFREESELETLIESLNRRGIREKPLRLALIREKQNILGSLHKVPLDFLSPSHVDSQNGEGKTRSMSKVGKQYENANMSYPPETSHDTILENLLRDLILETELKIHAGGLGSLKIKNRVLWRTAIETSSYDRQCKKLSWGGKFNVKNQDTIKKEDTSSEDGSRKDDSESRCSTPSVELNLPGQETNDEDKPRPVIQELASAILQIEQAIEHKYLKRPLGLDQKEKDKGEMRMPTPAMDRWECALMNSTSFPQLFLFFSSLDNSVIWARSALNAYCKICKRKNDPENMLLCDTCDKGHHIYCLKPKLSRIPSGDWHCPSCKPRDINVKSPVKKRRRFFSEDSDESDSEEQEEEKPKPCKVCSENGSELECVYCDSLYHLSCVNPPVRKVPKSKWSCHECRLANSQAQQVKKEKPSRPSTPEGEERLNVGLIEEGLDEESPQPSPPPKARKRPQPQRPQSPHLHIPPSDGERTSRRKSSKAASQRIHKFAKQLRSTGPWDNNDEEEEEEDKKVRNGSSRRRGSRRTMESQNSGLPLDNAALQEILDTIMHDKDAWPFLRPVTKSEVPDYHLVIKKPMDFGTIKHKLNMLEYTKNSELIADAHLLFKNCYEYNEEGSEVYKAGEKLESLFDKLCEENNLCDSNEDESVGHKRQRLY